MLLDLDIKEQTMIDEHYENWEVLMGESWESWYDTKELKEAFIQYHKNLSPARDIMII